MDIMSVVGIVVALGAILGGQALEGGHIGSILQMTAAMIVFGGTLGAVLLSFPLAHIKRAAKDVRQVFLPKHHDGAKLVETLVGFAQKARREGILAIEDDASRVEDPFMQKALSLAVDGAASAQIRDTMDVEMATAEEEAEAGPKVFEAAGGYSPTVGIIGAVLGLIHVMENLADPSKLGGGIAVAFVATVYGVGAANLFFLPMAGKMKVRNGHEALMRELVVQGVCALVDGENPRFIQQKLAGFLASGEREAAQKGGDSQKAQVKKAA